MRLSTTVCTNHYDIDIKLKLDLTFLFWLTVILIHNPFPTFPTTRILVKVLIHEIDFQQINHSENSGGFLL